MVAPDGRWLCESCAEGAGFDWESGNIPPKAGWPEALTPELGEVLGLMNFRTVPLAHAYRRAGHAIPTKCEDEQAFVLHRFIGFALKYGADWRKYASDDIAALKEA